MVAAQSPASAAFESAVRRMLPSRRTEGWRWSDLSAVLTPEKLHEISVNVDDKIDLEELEDDIRSNELIVALAIGLGADRVSKPISEGRRQLGAGGTTAFQTVSAGHVVFVDVIDAEGGIACHWHGIQVRAGAHVTKIVIQRGDGIVLVKNDVEVHNGARYRQFTLTEGAKFARFESNVELERVGAEVEIKGAYLCGPGKHADFTSTIQHIAPGGVTRQLVKGVARKGGRGVFQGKIVVAPHAQKTDARQYHHGMLLEDGAEIFAKPELMIHADDVQCAHGNTAGGLDERALFYMRARGLPEAEARALLIESFLVEAIPQGLPEEMHEELVGRMRTWLGAVR